MVVHLKAPVRPLHGGNTWIWKPGHPWFRIYHRDDRTPTAQHRRSFGPLSRFDPHDLTFANPGNCPSGRSVLYAAETLRTAGAEVFGDAKVATLCPHIRVAMLSPLAPARFQDLCKNGAMLTGALPAIGTADMPRDETQAWARAIYEDKPAGGSIVGVRYTSAHDEGAALAVWDSASHIQVLQDRQLVDPPILRRFVVAMDEVDIDVQVVAPGECRPCREANGRGHPC